MNNQASELMITYLFLDFLLYSYDRKNKEESLHLEKLCTNYMQTFLPQNCLEIFDKEIKEFHSYNKI